jgi:hypothetical protein
MHANSVVAASAAAGAAEENAAARARPIIKRTASALPRDTNFGRDLERRSWSDED